jgi:hypothetical protein
MHVVGGEARVKRRYTLPCAPAACQSDCTPSTGLAAQPALPAAAPSVCMSDAKRLHSSTCRVVTNPRREAATRRQAASRTSSLSAALLSASTPLRARAQAREWSDAMQLRRTRQQQRNRGEASKKGVLCCKGRGTYL